MDKDYSQEALFDSGIHLEIQDQKLFNSYNYRTSEFIAFAVYKMWYGVDPHKRANAPRLYTIKEPDWVNATPIEHIPPPLNCEEWYHQYVNQVYHFLNRGDFDASLVFIALLYIARMRFASMLCDASPPVVLYQLLVGAMIAAQKSNSDIRYTVKGWVSISSFHFQDVLLTERCFLQALQWDLYVTIEDYEKWYNTLYELSHEHRLVVKSAGFTEQEFIVFAQRHMVNRPDVVEEAQSIRQREGS